jgi:NAD(P)-dependent dehydrogenase (short-subunit alcohol dehydrogenase family)
MIARTSLGRIGQPDNIARVAIFLASDDSAWLSGEWHTAAGGYDKPARHRAEVSIPSGWAAPLRETRHRDA